MLNSEETEQAAKCRRIEDVKEVLSWLKGAKLDGDVLKFDELCTLPPEHGSINKPGHNILFVRPICCHLLWIYKYVTRVRDMDGILVVGPPGCGKVRYMYSK